MPTVTPVPEALLASLTSGAEFVFVVCTWYARQVSVPALRAQLLTIAAPLIDDLGPWRVQALRERVAEAAASTES
jgi:hypothetical protein